MSLSFAAALGTRPPGIYRADLDRAVRRMQKTGRAFTLTALARRWVRGRLRYGPESGEKAEREEAEVRKWDPREAWHPGDWAVFPVALSDRGVRRREPRAGMVTKVTGTAMVVHIDGQEAPRLWGVPAHFDEEDVAGWRASLDDEKARLARAGDERRRIDYVLWRNGAPIMSGLLGALRADGRFVEFEGRWFLRALIDPPSEAQLTALARRMLAEVPGAERVEALLSRLSDSGSPPPAEVFGFAMAMAERPDLFAAVKSGRHVRWALAAPPPGEYEARFAVYDPQTYEVLCEPGDALSPEDVRALWQLDLLATAVGAKV